MQQRSVAVSDGQRLRAQVDTVRTLYNRKRETLVKLLAQKLPAGVTLCAPQGGVNLWLLLPEDQDSMAVYQTALKAGLTLSPAAPFYWDVPAVNGLRLCFAGVPDEKLEALADTLAEPAPIRDSTD